MVELVDCPCSGVNLPRFVQPVILAILARGPLHGYLVAQRLAETPLFRKQPPDATGVYRVLKGMEQNGVLRSDWERGGGVARRSYAISEKGRSCLAQWGRTLISHQAFIADLLLFLQNADEPSSSSSSSSSSSLSFRSDGAEEELFGNIIPDAGETASGGESPRLFSGAETDIHTFIKELRVRALSGAPVSREDILRLLAIPPDSEEAAFLGRTARELARIVAGNEGRVWSAIGIDCRPCPMNCEFCAFGEKWGLIAEPHEWSDAEIVDAALAFVGAGASWVTLRTTEF